jgi:hypothetical protein
LIFTSRHAQNNFNKEFYKDELWLQQREFYAGCNKAPVLTYHVWRAEKSAMQRARYSSCGLPRRESAAHRHM